VAEFILSDAPLVVGPTVPGPHAALLDLAVRTATSAPSAGSGSHPTLPHCLIRGLDAALRRFYGVHEFSNQPDCLLRIAIGRAAGDVRLAEGSNVLRGAEVLELHLWNEHLPNLPSHGTGLGRSNALRRRIGESLSRLACHITSEPSLGRIEALRARTAFVSGNRTGKLLRIARAYGFDTVHTAGPCSAWRRAHDFWENFFIWGLAWTFNPAALRGKGLLRLRCEIWISRDAFMARYGLGSVDRRREFGTVLPSPSRRDGPSLVSRRTLGIQGALAGVAECCATAPSGLDRRRGRFE
jgi:hypothetical protein